MGRSQFHRETTGERAPSEHELTRTAAGPHRRHRLRLCLRAAIAVPAFVGVAAGSIPSATAPASSYQNGLVTTPNPIDRSANLPITGNVLGGKHFRGPIPYGSTSRFAAPLGSTSLDSFLRYSGVPQTPSGYPQIYSPFYSSTGTVTTTVPGYQGIFTPASPRIAGGTSSWRTDQPTDVMAMTEIPEPQVSAGERSSVVGSEVGALPQVRYWRPLSESPADTSDVVTDESAGRLPMQPGERLMTPEEVRSRLEQLRRGLDRIQSDASQLGQNSSVDRATPAQQLPPIEQGQENTGLSDESVPEGLKILPPTSPRLELYDPSAHPGQPVAGQVQSVPAEPAKLPAWQRVEETSRALDASARFLNRPTDDPADGRRDGRKTGDPAQGTPVPDRNQAQPASGQASVPAPAPQTYENAGSITQKQFDYYLTAAERYMQQGRYDRAANSFTLALAYIPHDARAHLGKSHALLATGEYVAGAASLARAVEIDVRYALKRIDLVETIGGPDLFVQRIGELETRAESGGSPEPQFLLAYVYYQMDLPERAKAALERARKGPAFSAAANLLEAALGTSAEPG